MENIMQKVTGWAYFKEAAFFVAVLLVLMAWKFANEGRD